MKFKTPICEKCNRILKGKVPHDTAVICFFCNNPRFDDADDANTALKSTDVNTD
jgi:hypothetical protein